jgi:hypothetical protein
MKILNKEIGFQEILGITALFVAVIAGFFSVMGIGMLFSGAYVSSMIMATSLELGKVVATSFLYRYWKKITSALKVYMTIAVLVLMVITSLGVFGWLSSAYQSSALEYEIAQQRTAALVEQKSTIQSELGMAKQRVDLMLSIRTDQEKRMNEALSNPILSRNPTQLRQVQEQNIDMIKRTDSDLTEEKKKYSDISNKLSDAEVRIIESKTNSAKTKDIITFKFVADALGLDLNTTVKWFIIVIIIVFDPLAISLILAYNVAMSNKKEDPIEVATEPLPTSTEVVLPPKKEIERQSEIEPDPIIVEKKEEETINPPVPPPPPSPVKPHGPFNRDHDVLNK